MSLRWSDNDRGIDDRKERGGIRGAMTLRNAGRIHSPRINRFEDVVYWIEINLERAQDLWLDRSPPLRIVDLGCGAGYFLYVCKCFGHHVLGFDTDNEPLFRATTEILDVPRVIGRIERQTPLPDLHQTFDLVTAHRICFHRIGRVRDGVEWSPAEWVS